MILFNIFIIVAVGWVLMKIPKWFNRVIADEENQFDQIHPTKDIVAGREANIAMVGSHKEWSIRYSRGLVSFQDDGFVRITVMNGPVMLREFYGFGGHVVHRATHWLRNNDMFTEEDLALFKEVIERGYNFSGKPDQHESI